MNKAVLRMNRQGRRALKVAIRRKEGEHENGNQGGNNGGGNSGGADSQGGGDQNNGGQQFDPTSFWTSPPSDGNGAPGNGNPSESNQSGGGTNGNQNQQQQNQQPTPVQQLGTELNQMISGFTIPAPVFTAEVGEQIANGDFSGVNDAIQASIQASMGANLRVVAKLLNGFKTHLEENFQQQIDRINTGRDNNSHLESIFPELVSNPGIRPQVEGVFNQSLLHTKGDRKAAGEMARNMLKFMGTELNRSLNDSGNSHSDNSAGSQSLIESLIGGN